MTPPLKAVFLDAGNTLFRPYPSVGEVYARLARKHGCRADPAWVDRRFRAEWKRRNGLAQLKDEKHEKLWWRNLVRHVFGGKFSDEASFGAYYEELYREFARPRTWRLYPDTLKALERLRRRGLVLGVVSNWDARLFKLCDGLGVTKRVDFILASAVEGAVKPEREIFRRALRKARAKPGQALHVGDSFREDYWGARRAGLRALLMDRGGKGVRGAECVRSLADVEKRIFQKPA